MDASLTKSKQDLLAMMSKIIMLNNMCKDGEVAKIDSNFVKEELESVQLKPAAAAAAMQKAALVKTLESMLKKFSTIHQLNNVHAEYELKNMAEQLITARKQLEPHL